jgi:hypothetical protein
MSRWWQNLRETTVDHAAWEMFVMRGLCAWLMWRMLPDAVPFTTQPLPNGLGHLVDLTFLGHPATFALLRNLAPVALGLYALGVAPLLSLGYMAALLTGVGALENSQGAIGHHLQILCLVALAQWVAYAAALKKSGTRMAEWGLLPAVAAHRSATQAAKLLLAAGYVTSGWTKVIASGGQWVLQLPNIALQLVKSQANVFYDTLTPQPAWATALPRLIADHPNLTRLAFTPGLLLELGAFLALTGRRASFWIGLGLLAMHVLARKLMDLGFVAHEWLLIIYFINVPWLVCCALQRLRASIGK